VCPANRSATPPRRHATRNPCTASAAGIVRSSRAAGEIANAARHTPTALASDRSRPRNTSATEGVTSGAGCEFFDTTHTPNAAFFTRSSADRA